MTLDLASLYPQAEKLLGSTRLKTLVIGEFAEWSPAPGPVKAQMVAAGMLAEAKHDDRHLAFRDLIDNDGRYQAHPLGDLTEALGRDPIYRRHDRHSEGRDAHTRQSDRRLLAIYRDRRAAAQTRCARARSALFASCRCSISMRCPS